MLLQGSRLHQARAHLTSQARVHPITLAHPRPPSQAHPHLTSPMPMMLTKERMTIPSSLGLRTSPQPPPWRSPAITISTSMEAPSVPLLPLHWVLQLLDHLVLRLIGMTLQPSHPALVPGTLSYHPPPHQALAVRLSPILHGSLGSASHPGVPPHPPTPWFHRTHLASVRRHRLVQDLPECGLQDRVGPAPPCLVDTQMFGCVVVAFRMSLHLAAAAMAIFNQMGWWSHGRGKGSMRNVHRTSWS